MSRPLVCGGAYDRHVWVTIPGWRVTPWCSRCLQFASPATSKRLAKRSSS